MTFASEDVTYCQNDNCSKKCWRYWKQYRFKENELYWFMPICEKERRKLDGRKEK